MPTNPEKMKNYRFSKEADLCREFLKLIPDEWTAYNETGGFDILLVHENGMQIGIEAKLTLNSKVLMQAVLGRNNAGYPGPDFRAVLVGRVVAENEALAKAFGVTVLTLRTKLIEPRMRTFSKGAAEGPPRPHHELTYNSRLPEFKISEYNPNAFAWADRDYWIDEAPCARISLPEYVPDVEAGHPAPQTLSIWKIKAMKVCIYVQKEKTISRALFKVLKIDPGRWMDGYSMIKGQKRGEWVAGPSFPSDVYRKQHPTIYAKIEDDYSIWSKQLGL